MFLSWLFIGHEEIFHQVQMHVQFNADYKQKIRKKIRKSSDQWETSCSSVVSFVFQQAPVSMKADWQIVTCLKLLLLFWSMIMDLSKAHKSCGASLPRQSWQPMAKLHPLFCSIKLFYYSFLWWWDWVDGFLCIAISSKQTVFNMGLWMEGSCLLPYLIKAQDLVTWAQQEEGESPPGSCCCMKWWEEKNNTQS